MPAPCGARPVSRPSTTCGSRAPRAPVPQSPPTTPPAASCSRKLLRSFGLYSGCRSRKRSCCVRPTAALIRAEPQVVALNLVQSEDNLVARRDYTRHMQIVAFLAKDVPVALHAGELWLGYVPPIEVDPRDGTVTLDGRVLAVEPVRDVPLGRRYVLG